jgi:poly(ADP-ribose) glycohydrolase
LTTNKSSLQLQGAMRYVSHPSQIRSHKVADDLQLHPTSPFPFGRSFPIFTKISVPFSTVQERKMGSEYKLPCSPSYFCEDRFSILSDGDDGDLIVPFWPVFIKLFNQPITTPVQLIDLLETIAVTLRQKSSTDHIFLTSFLQNNLQPDFYTRTWPVLVDLALNLPQLFPTSSLPVLSTSQPPLCLSRSQVGCLVVHQFLCTLSPPSWQEGFQSFHIWYGSVQPHAGAVEAYLTALFVYFERISGPIDGSPFNYSKDEWSISYTLTSDSLPSLHTSLKEDVLSPFRVTYLPTASTHPSLLGLESGASVISANKFIGFGRTGTQEEVHVGSSPESCPAVLITPPLKDGEVLVVNGVEAMVVIEGYGRTAHCGEILSGPVVFSEDERHAHKQKWKNRTMLFMDALEFDLEDHSLGLPDVKPGNVARELCKAYTAFRSSQNTSGAPYKDVYTGFWGCRTFGGNVSVKTMVQWCAASKAGVGCLKFICSGEEQERFGGRIEGFVEGLRGLEVKTGELEEVLLELSVLDVGGGEDALDVVRERLRRMREGNGL